MSRGRDGTRIRTPVHPGPGESWTQGGWFLRSWGGRRAAGRAARVTSTLTRFAHSKRTRGKRPPRLCGSDGCVFYGTEADGAPGKPPKRVCGWERAGEELRGHVGSAAADDRVLGTQGAAAGSVSPRRRGCRTQAGPRLVMFLHTFLLRLLQSKADFWKTQQTETQTFTHDPQIFTDMFYLYLHSVYVHMGRAGLYRPSILSAVSVRQSILSVHRLLLPRVNPGRALALRDAVRAARRDEDATCRRRTRWQVASSPGGPGRHGSLGAEWGLRSPTGQDTGKAGVEGVCLGPVRRVPEPELVSLLRRHAVPLLAGVPPGSFSELTDGPADLLLEDDVLFPSFRPSVLSVSLPQGTWEHRLALLGVGQGAWSRGREGGGEAGAPSFPASEPQDRWTGPWAP